MLAHARVTRYMLHAYSRARERTRERVELQLGAHTPRVP